MKTLYSIALSGLITITSFLPVAFAQNPAESWTLSQPESGNKTYVARDYISLEPGFSYEATSGNTFSAKIDQTLLFPPTSNTYAKADGTITTSSTEGAVVGNLSGAFDVSSGGAATYSVPIECPPGIQGMQPNISLIYNSQSGNGMAGMCWNVGGLSMISRVPKNHYYESEKSGIIWDNTSPLALDGQRLIKIQEWGTDSVEYRTESGLDKVIGYRVLTSGPIFFKVYTKDGHILEYGGTDQYFYYDEDLYNISFSNLPVKIKSYRSLYSEYLALGWALSKATDSNGNYIRYTYSNTLWKKTATGNAYYDYYFGDNRISSIEYGNNNTKVAGINFQYKDKTSSFIQYIGGMETKNRLILDKIEIKGPNAELLETYQLKHNSQDGNDFLTEIKRVNASGEFIHPLKFEWYPMNYSYEYDNNLTYSVTPSLTALSNNDANFTPVSFGDFDGDGLTDIVMKANLNDWGKNLWIVYRNTGNGSFQYKYEETLECPGKFDIKENTFLFLDLDGDSKDELYVGRVVKNTNPLSYTYRLDCYKYINGVFQRYSSGDMTHSTGLDVYNERGALHAVPGDFTGKGTPQFIIFSTNNTPRFHLTTLSLPNGLPSNWGSGQSKILLSDINGNGKMEIAYIKRNANNTYDATTVFYEYGANQSASFGAILSTSLFHYNDNIFNGDFNGDGNTDFLVRTPYLYGGGSWKILISTGTSFMETSMNSSIESDVDPGDVSVADVNKDGKSDIVIVDPNNGASLSTLRVLVNTGGTTFIEKTLNTSFPLPSGIITASSKFKTSHGQDFFWSTNLVTGKTQILSLCKDKWFNKINKIENAFGEQIVISYKDNRNPYQASQKIMSADNGEINSIYNNFLPQLETVNTVTATNTNLSYIFENAFVHMEGRGFLGFGKITIKDAVKTITQVSENQLNSSFHILYPYKTTTKLTSSTLISETTSNYSIVDYGEKKYFLRPNNTVSTDYLKGTTTTTTFLNYDSDRNPQTITTNFGNGITSTQSLTYIKKGSYFLNKLSSAQITQKATGQQDVTRKEYFFYDEKGNIIQQTKDSTHVNQVRTSYGNYDNYGNPQKITTVANGITRSQTLTYSSSGRFVKTKKNDQFNETTTYNYNESKGLLTSEVDRLGTTSYQYDNWGRLKLTTYPDGIKTANVLQWAGSINDKPSGTKYYGYTETSGESPVIVWYDALGREIRSESYGLNQKKIRIDTEYNNKGQLYRVSEPYFSNGSKTWAATHTYDSYGRVTQTVTPMGTTAYTYSNLTTTVASPTGTNVTTTNTAGWTVSQTVNGKSVSFTHYANGQVKTATPEDGQAIAIEYDLQGNRTKLIDPDAGTIISEYDGWGQLKKERQAVHNATQITTEYNYLPSGLLNYQLRNGEYTNYGYDNLYRLQWVSIAGKHSQGFDYDQWDRIIQTRDTVENSKVFVRKTEYDVFGRITKAIYPTGYYTQNHYDANGYLQKVTDRERRRVWEVMEENARGQLKREKKGNKETTYTYYNTGRPEFVQASEIIDNLYRFDGKGNLTYRDEYAVSLSSYEDFQYDAQNRLTSWNPNPGGTKTVAYDNSTGNIQSKSDLGNSIFNYGEINNKPHALTSISGIPADFPANNLTVTYTDFKKIKTLTEGNKFYQLTYGVDEQRRKSVVL
jgi:YD repeat-containing protein